MAKLKQETIAAQIGNRKCERTGAVNMPVYFSTAYQHADLGVSTGYDYTRTGNPTRDALQEALAELENGTHAFATSSGMSAIQLVFQLFKTGEHIISSQDLYGGTFRYFEQFGAQYQIGFSYWDGAEITDLEKLIRPETKAIFIETPTNPLMQETDIAAVAKWAHGHDLLVIVDNTFYTPVLQQPLTLGADIVIHSATKYLGGHNDVLAGAVIVKEEPLGKFFFEQLNATGTVLSPFDSWLLIRGLKTLVLRVRQHQANAQKIAAFLEEHELVEEVRYPGRGGMISFFIRDAALVSPLLKELELFTFAESLGGVESLITYPTTQTHADIPVELRNSYGLTDKLLRISVGIEASEDLIADLAKALDKVLEGVSARG
ncbi:aminotransferase class I/II-fold pyridoxal phosphate-dependent enzyme [Listeria sp. FSL L7-1434]|uniref:aminotransferase class I/II-fold pyridoxal phosphate-dependent enzyme n=1 Tax=Listeria cossartiae TaxID=2838249 RepID=UPI001623BEDD|nr:aminotransferase class I/II-fold pyridoxal phosphate-dependent enzyme [Listeria cossartiae]MBC1548334.1 aminotransferase class I/II-fold pyridoxal phosphate-dependent enzyme [Listeria cossartiae subsp. cossartiae]